MKQKSGPKKGTKITRMTNRQRWSRGADGTYNYAGVCPFNNLVCWTMNAFVGRKHRNEGG
jgi:hypothetical protein